ncbi:bis(5'-nucleosyl)-tetraphosphatase PrpE [asymmetrical] [Lentibacillus populi]|uniref:Bis(5'-nucleosyl)-tetraphosphatase PrpE [asymmetrical] n=1 Tax=Lentibacillus populi TaxID=1827502 RepID=A0A9W5TX69_9BACI|nr:bis(5'-nucleosyl)-tetraphosphatase PrpE [Lentibacillus populi]MBT2215451.1 bis(5'-nucleosyl)-tetraphosphatase PrpE [Virgibacillus dakarensis]GGB40301.1 bis(5'-nucleosyl)-tetraphosphatase PrpE [asymmetrical] [Lentibacillus populi]
MKIDVIGDVHGCLNELHTLFNKLGYEKQDDSFIHPDGRLPVFVGDITDRGPHSMDVIRLVCGMVLDQNRARYVPGNHCNKLYRYFSGNNVMLKHGLETTVAEFQVLNAKAQSSIKKQFMTLYENAPLYLEIPEANAIVAHAGIKESYIGRYGKKVKTFVLYGDISGEYYPDGRPIRRDWARHYHGDRWIVYGHTPVMEPRLVNKTVNIDTGCVFGNALTAFRLPEEETVTVPSSQPFIAEKFTHFD